FRGNRRVIWRSPARRGATGGRCRPPGRAAQRKRTVAVGGRPPRTLYLSRVRDAGAPCSGGTPESEMTQLTVHACVASTLGRARDSSRRHSPTDKAVAAMAMEQVFPKNRLPFVPCELVAR